MDSKKFSDSDARIRERAKTIISMLDKIDFSGRTEVRPNVELRLAVDEPNVDWDSEGLSSVLPDDRILATVLHSGLSDCQAVLVTADLGLKLKAKSRGIRCHMLSDGLRLELGRSPEQEELTKLRKRIHLIESRLPLLKLEVVSKDGLDGVGRFRLERAATLSPLAIESELAEAQKRLSYSPPNLGRYGSMASVLSIYGPSQNEIERYKDDVEKYINQLRRHLESKMSHIEFCSRSLELRFVLVNEGTSPAEDVDIFLYFPDGFHICGSEDFPNEPKAPDKPVPPRTLAEMMMPSIGISNFNVPLGPFGELHGQARVGSPNRPIIKKTNSYEVTYSLERLKHGLKTELDAIYLVFPSFEGARSFNIKYSVLAGNVPEPSSGRVDIIVETQC